MCEVPQEDIPHLMFFSFLFATELHESLCCFFKPFTWNTVFLTSSKL